MKRFPRVTAICEIPRKSLKLNWSFHAGVDIYAVKELLVHQDIRTSMVYAKANMDTLRHAVERLKN